MSKTQRNIQKVEKKMWLDGALPPLELQHVWYEMKQKREWRSIALVPVTDDINSLSIAHGMALMAVREPHEAVWVVNGSSCDVDNILPEGVDNPGDKNDAFPYKFVDLAKLGISQEKQLFTAERLLDQLADNADANIRFIFAVDCIINKTHAISLCRSVDVVILCTALGRTTFKDIKRTVEIVGSDSILGSVVLHPKKEKAGDQQKITLFDLFKLNKKKKKKKKKK